MKIAVLTPHIKHEALTAAIIEGLYDHGIDIKASDHSNGVHPKDVISDHDFIEFAKTADYVWVFWGKGPDPRWPPTHSDRFPKYYLLNEIDRKEITV